MVLWGTRIFPEELVEGGCGEDRQFGRYGIHVYSNRNWLRGGVGMIGKMGVMWYTYFPIRTG